MNQDRHKEVAGSEFIVDWINPIDAAYFRFREKIKLGQRIDSRIVEGSADEAWMEVGKGEGVGSCRIIPPSARAVSRIRVTISGPVPVNLSDLAVF